MSDTPDDAGSSAAADAQYARDRVEEMTRQAEADEHSSVDKAKAAFEEELGRSKETPTATAPTPPPPVPNPAEDENSGIAPDISHE